MSSTVIGYTVISLLTVMFSVYVLNNYLTGASDLLPNARSDAHYFFNNSSATYTKMSATLIWNDVEIENDGVYLVMRFQFENGINGTFQGRERSYFDYYTEFII